MHSLKKLSRGDKVAILSPSFAAPGKWPHVYELGLSRLRDIFGLIPVEYPTTKKLGASGEERSHDLIAAFEDGSIGAIITSIGGSDQVTYVKNLPSAPFVKNPKPFFGFSDNTHFANFLWLNGIPSFYGGALFTQFAMQTQMDDYTIEYLKHALFENGEFELLPSRLFNEKGLNWDNEKNLEMARDYEQNSGWVWAGGMTNTSGISWGGCLESIDELLRHEIGMPALKDFERIILITETSEGLPSAEQVRDIYRALGERGILARIQGILVGRPKAWEFDKPLNDQERETYRTAQRNAILQVVETYNSRIPLVFNLNIGHTDPQIALPYGRRIRINPSERRIWAEF